MNQPATDATDAPLVARADFQYRWRVYVFFIMVFGYGLWSLRDGFIKWPAENARNHAMIERNEKPLEVDHNEAGILINQALGILLPGFSLPLFIWLMYRSRGAYRLTDDTLELPGREPIPLDRIQSLDKSRWDRKGIAVIEYQAAGGNPQTAILRDMVYERSATDKIVERIEKSLAGPAGMISQSPDAGET